MTGISNEQKVAIMASRLKRRSLGLPDDTASCHECHHVYHWPSKDLGGFMRCGAQGGNYCDGLNPNGQCVHFQKRVETPRIKKMSVASKLGWGLLVMTPFAISFGIWAGLPPTECLSYVEKAPEGIGSVECDHVDHILTIENEFVTCTCPKE